MPETIQAAHDLTIRLDPTAWRLYNGAQSPGEPIALLEAYPDEIRCAPAFARARQLPGEGHLTPADVARVVVGWAPESHNWHLGLMLAARPETNFRSRWCGLASWPSGQAGEHSAQARYAGQSLARLIDRPFHVVPPVEPVRVAVNETQPIQATRGMPEPVAPAIAPIPTQAPPFEFGDWVFAATSRGLIWRRRSRSILTAALRILGLMALAALFLVLGIGSQTRGLAAVNPSWLPWLGIGVTGLLLVILLMDVQAVLSVSDVIIDRSARQIRRQNRFMGTTLWRVPFDAAAYILVSQTPPHPEGRENSGEPVSTTQDVWIHLYDGRRFLPVVSLERVEGRCRDWSSVRHTLKTPGRRRLILAHFDSPAHHAAQVMAQAMDVDVWLDVRK